MSIKNLVATLMYKTFILINKLYTQYSECTIFVYSVIVGHRNLLFLSFTYKESLNCLLLEYILFLLTEI